MRLFFGGIFDFDIKKERLIEVERELEVPDVWNEPDRAQALGQERSSLELVVNTIENLETGVADASEVLQLQLLWLTVN